MAAIDKDDVVKKGVFDNAGDSADKNKPKVDSLTESIKKLNQEVAKTTKESLGTVKPKDIKSIEELNVLAAKANQTAKNRLEINKQIQKDQIIIQEQRKANNKELRNEIVLENKQAGTLEKIAATSKKLRTEREGLNLETRKGQKRLREINLQLDRNNKFVERNSDRLKQQRLSIGRYGKALNGLRSNLIKLGAAFGVGFGINQLRSFASESIKLFREQQKAVAQVEAGLKSTGNQAGFTIAELKKQASELQKTTLFGDEEILKGATAQLLTFTNIAGEQFSRTQQAALDLATRLDGDLKSASIQLGKALNDPVANLSALSRSGIQFTTEQKKVIKSLQESGRLAEAQTLILDELNKQYGGSAEAAAEADGGITQLSNAIGDAKEKLGELILDGLKPTIQSLQEFFSSLTEEDIQRFVDTLAAIGRTLWIVIRAFAVFKTAMLALKLKDRISDFISFRKSVKASGDGAIKATSSVKAFGQALKSVGFALAITFIIEMTREFVRLTSGMAQATIQAEEFAKATEKAGESVDNFNKINNTALQEQINGIRQKNLSQKEETRLINEATVAANKRTEARIADLRAAKIETLALLERAKAEQKRLKEQKGLGLFDFSGEDSIALGKANLAVIKLNANERNLSTQILALKESQASLNQTIIDGEIDLSRMDKTTKEQSKSTKELTLDIEKLASMVNSLKKSQRDIWDELSDDTGVKNLDKIIDNLDSLHEADMQRKLDVADIRVLQEEINGDEEAILEARINRINVQLELDKAATESGAERYKLELQSQLDIEALVLESQQRVADEEAKILADRAKQQNEYIKSLEQGWVKALDARIALFNDEQKAAEKQADFFIKQSDKGDVEAEQSITAARERARQAEEEAKKAEKQKQIALMVSAFLQAFNNALGEGKNVGQALGEAATGVAASSALIPSIISAVPTFLEGTENTGSHGQGVDGKGGFHAILHPNEGVATKEVNMKKEKAGLTLGGAVDKAIAYDNLMNRDFTNGLTDGNQIAVGWDNHLLVDQMLKVQDEVKNLTKVMEGKSDTSIGEVTKHTMAILSKSKKGGNKTTSVFVVKK